MKELSESQFRKNFISTLDKISKTNLPIIVNRENSQSVVMLSIRAYRAIESFIDIVKNPVGYIDLLKKIEDNDFKLIDKT